MSGNAYGNECVLLEQGLIAAGWGLNDLPLEHQLRDGCTNPALYLERAQIAFPEDQSLRSVIDVFAHQMQVGDICWMYVSHLGEYWCSVLTGSFEYREGENYDLFDIHITRRCRWVRVGTADAVPGVIVRAFAGPFGTVSKLVTSVETAREAAEVALGLQQPNLGLNLFSLTGPDDLEDLAALYLQHQGWCVLPSTAKTTMASYEFVLVHPASGRRAGLQVKSGNVWRLAQSVSDEFDEFFVLLANERAVIEGNDPRITRLSPTDVESFALQNRRILPKRLQNKWNPAFQV